MLFLNLFKKIHPPVGNFIQGKALAADKRIFCHTLALGIVCHQGNHGVGKCLDIIVGDYYTVFAAFNKMVYRSERVFNYGAKRVALSNPVPCCTQCTKPSRAQHSKLAGVSAQKKPRITQNNAAAIYEF
jgi:hypothetical protein